MPARRPGKKRSRRDAFSQHWAYLTAAGGEDRLLHFLGGGASRIGEGVVMVEGRPKDARGEPIEPAFARQAMSTGGDAVPIEEAALARALAQEMTGALRKGPAPWTLQVIAPDSSARAQDPRQRIAAAVDETITEALDRALPRKIADAFVDSADEAEWLAQIWIVNDEQALTGFTRVTGALSRWPAGRTPLADRLEATSRAELKLAEAFDWLGLSPDKGEVVVDLGALSGAWTQALHRQGARVLMVDAHPPKLGISPKKVTPIEASPFVFAPDETVDWLCMHLNRRPLDAAKVIAKWGRRAWARHVLASFPLLGENAAAELEQILQILDDAGWRGLRARQLYFDGEEVTVYGWLDPKRLAGGPKAPFRPRAHDRRQVTELIARERTGREVRGSALRGASSPRGRPSHGRRPGPRRGPRG